MDSFKAYQGLVLITKEGDIANGVYNRHGVIIRIRNGYLCDDVTDDGEIHPAIESSDGSHIEHWKNGILHCEDGPAVIDVIDDYEEWWEDGKLMKRT